MHGALLEMNKHDILGHEFCGVIAEVGSKVSKRKVG
jgi:threonine dehydrogenase-like Zn-dependent dehydrogenase